MMNKVFILLLSIFLSVPGMFGQFKLETESFGIDNSSIKARTKKRLDGEGNPAAILRIQIPMLGDALITSPDQVGDQEYEPGEFIVYLAEGSKRISIKHPDFEPFNYTFPELLKGKTVYKLVLKVPQDYLSLGEISVKIKTNVVEATLDINNQVLTTSDGQFLLKLKKGNYPYTLSTKLPGFEPQQGTLAVTEEDAKLYGRIDYYIELQSHKKSNLHIINAEGSLIKIDGREIGKIKGSVSLPIGRHHVDVAVGGFTKSFDIDLVNDDHNLDADIRVPLIIVSPSTGEFSIQPLDNNALKPSVSKFKAGQPVKILGNYKIVAKAKGYDESTLDVAAYPDMDYLNKSVPMTSKAHHLYYGSPTIKMDRAKAFKEYQKLAAKNDDLAMWEYGKILVDQNEHERGKAFIMKSADKGQPDAALYVARNYVDLDASKRKHYAKVALDGGKNEAHEILGDLYTSVPPIDFKKAYEEFSCYNSPYSRIRRAEIAKINPELPYVDLSEIVALLESIEDVDKYYKKAQWLLGLMAYNGYGMTKNVDKALSYWGKSDAEILSQDALLVMAMANLNSNSYLTYYVNHIDIPAIKSDKVMYKGMSIIEFLRLAARKFDKENVGTAFKMFSKAYDLGDRSQSTLTYLGKYYKDGQGTYKNSKKAKEFLQMSADMHGDARCIRWLGNIYEDEKNLSTAEEYYIKAIDKGDDIAKGYLATILFNRGKAYYPQAEKYWTEAATKANHKPSIKKLITYYEKVKKNQSMANVWKKKL